MDAWWVWWCSRSSTSPRPTWTAEKLAVVTGTAVVSNKVTDVIDTSALLESLLGIPSGMYEDNYNEMTVV